MDKEDYKDRRTPLPNIANVSCLEMVTDDLRTLGIGYNDGRTLLFDILDLTWEDFTVLDESKGAVRAMKMHKFHHEKIKNYQKAVLVTVVRQKVSQFQWSYITTKTLLQNKNCDKYFNLKDYETIATEVEMPCIVSDVISGFDWYRARCGRETLHKHLLKGLIAY